MKMKLDLGILIQDCVENMKINYGTKLFEVLKIELLDFLEVNKIS